MESLRFEKFKELIRSKKKLENELKVKIVLGDKSITIEGNGLDEYEAKIVLDAVNFGFSTEKALLLKDSEILFEKVNIKDFSKKKNLNEVRARIIGTKGKTLKTLEEISGCSIKLEDNTVGIIGYAESIGSATTAIENLVKGSKQSNVYRYLEKSNRNKDVS